MTSEKLLTVTNMSKSFGIVRALRGVDLDVRDGEVHGLIGENGSGKSTLASIAAGQQRADAGSMLLAGRPWNPGTVTEALAGGVGMIVQESGVVPGISVAENILLGAVPEFTRAGLVDRRRLEAEARRALELVGVDGIDVRTPAGALDFQARKLVEIARVMRARPRVVVVDETTTALSEDGRRILYRLVSEQRQRGAVIFISHDLDEITSVCDRLTVLRDGEIIRTFDRDEYDEHAIRAAMIGRELEGEYYRQDAQPSARPEILLSARGLVVGDALRGVDLDVRAGEIVGVGGLSQSGMHELGKALFGAAHLDAGRVTVRGARITNEKRAVRASVGYVSKDRDTESLSLGASIRDNIASAGLRLIGRGRGGFVTPGAERRYVRRPFEQLSIKAPSDRQPVSTLSGGNKQKVAFGKWIASGSEVLILDGPTRGVDVGVKQSMYRLMTRLKAEGRAIVLISEEMPELIGMCDRLLVMKDGKVSREFVRGPELNEMEIIQCMI